MTYFDPQVFTPYGGSTSFSELLDPSDSESAIIVIDGAYADPDAVRRHALSQAFECRGPFPGMRTRPSTTPAMRAVIEHHIGQRAAFWPTVYDNGAFQMTYDTRENVLFVHADPCWIGLVYLTPHPPARSGTSFYRHLETGALRRGVGEEIDELCAADGGHPSRWTEVFSVENVYNRMILFQGRWYHRPTGFFGRAPRTARLFQTFFFCTEGYGDCSSMRSLEAEMRADFTRNEVSGMPSR